MNQQKLKALKVIAGDESFEGMGTIERIAYLVHLGLDDRAQALPDLQRLFFNDINNVTYLGALPNVILNSMRDALGWPDTYHKLARTQVEYDFWTNIANGNLVLGNIQLTQDRCTSIFDHSVTIPITNLWLEQNHVIRLVDSVDATMSLPALEDSEFGSRVFVYNHNEVAVTINGGRNTSINGVDSIVLSSKYFEIINIDSISGDGFIAFIVIPAE